AWEQFNGIQIASVVNVAKETKGFQFALINVADTSSGVSIGLVNIIRHGYHKISFSANELTNSNVSIKTGNAKFYTMLMAGANVSNNEKIYTGGYGIGHDFILNRRFSISSEASGHAVFLGNWEYPGILSKGQLQGQYKLNKTFGIFAGPSFSVYKSNSQTQISHGFKTSVAPSYAKVYNSSTQGWIGWNLGITLF
ncbi:MAG: hypothetical protein JWQ25_1550, partial [Daejeonella sp.]|nr:hypothetical protein [Daejeonella sp.]